MSQVRVSDTSNKRTSNLISFFSTCLTLILISVINAFLSKFDLHIIVQGDINAFLSKKENSYSSLYSEMLSGIGNLS